MQQHRHSIEWRCEGCGSCRRPQLLDRRTHQGSLHPTNRALHGTLATLHTHVHICRRKRHCGDMQSDLMHIPDEFIIFRINMLNIVSAMAQKAERKLWHPMPTELRARIATFLKLRCLSPIGSKVIRIKMTRLAQELGTSRLNVSEALNAMQADGVLHFSRGIISVPQVEKLR